MLKKIILSLVLLLFCISSVLAATTTKKSKLPYKSRIIEIETKDHHILKAKLMYPKEKGLHYPTIILLHSLGCSNTFWGDLPENFVKQGYAVLAFDFRGHGMSNQDSKFRTKSWANFQTKTYLKYPYDLTDIIEKTKQLTKKASFDDYAILGADIGANTAVIYTTKTYPKPKAIVLLNPYLSFKGLTIFNHTGEIPISKIGSIPILTMCSTHDTSAVRQQIILKNFVNGEFIIHNTETQSSGMNILKLDPKCNDKAIQFINEYLPPKVPEIKVETNNVTKEKTTTK